MKPILENGLLYKAALTVWKKLTLFYSTSCIKKFFDLIGVWHADSNIRRLITNYLGRSSHAKKSFTYRILCFIGSKVDKLAGLIHSFFSKQSKTSLLVGALDVIKNETRANSFKIASAVILPIIAGFSIITTIRGTWSHSSLIFVLFFCVIYIASLASVDKWSRWIKNSIIYRVCHYLWE